MKKLLRVVVHRPENNRMKPGAISQAPEMIELKRIYQDMNEHERERTIKHLRDAINQGGSYDARDGL